MATDKSITDLTGVTTFGAASFFTLVTAAGDNAKISGANLTTQLAGAVATAIAPVLVSVSGDYTIVDSDIIVVVTGSNAATISLKASPDIGDKATIIRASTATVTVAGNGINIGGSSTQALPTIYDVVNVLSIQTDWVYSS